MCRSGVSGQRYPERNQPQRPQGGAFAKSGQSKCARPEDARSAVNVLPAGSPLQTISSTTRDRHRLACPNLLDRTATVKQNKYSPWA